MAKRISNIKFDEAWYLSKYPDVKEAVKRGVVAGGREHYVLSGYYEHRMPCSILVNEKWYLEAYPDVADAIRGGVYKSGQAHFDLAGFREGRMPYPNFQL
jgi:3-phytase/alkaline phosphatase D